MFTVVYPRIRRARRLAHERDRTTQNRRWRASAGQRAPGRAGIPAAALVPVEARIVLARRELVGLPDHRLAGAEHEVAVGRHRLGELIERAPEGVGIEVEQHVAAQYDVELARARRRLQQVVALEVYQTLQGVIGLLVQ